MRRLSSKCKNNPVVPKSVGEAAKSPRNRGASVNYAVEDDSDEPNDDESFEVELIVDSRFVHGKHQYKIRWKGCGPDSDTWENEDNLDCAELIADFQREAEKRENHLTKKPPNKRSLPTKGRKSSLAKKSRKSDLAVNESEKSDGKKISKKSESVEENDHPLTKDKVETNDNSVEQPSKSSQSTPKAKKLKRSKKSEVQNTHNDESDSDETEWEVSKIVDSVLLKDGTRQFLVRWKGFNSKHDSWEPEANITASDLITKYLLAEQKRNEVDRESREVRRSVNRYNPELTKRHSARSASKKSDGVWSLDTKHSYRQLLDEESSSDSSQYNSTHIPRQDMLMKTPHSDKHHSVVDLQSESSASSWLSKRCLIM